MRHIILLYLLMLCAFAPQARAQSYWDNYELLNTRSGLSHNIVLSVLQDQEGFLWIGTFNGLCRYDGYTMTVYTDELDPTGQGWAYAVDVIMEDREHHIWIGTRAGMLAMFNKQTGQWKRFYTASSVPITVIYQTPGGTICTGNSIGEMGVLNTRTDSVEFQAKLPGKVLSISGPEHNLFVVLHGSDNFEKRPIPGKKVTGSYIEKGEVCTNGDLLFSPVSLIRNNGEKVAEFPIKEEFYGDMVIKSGKGPGHNFLLTNGKLIVEYDPKGTVISTFHVSDNPVPLDSRPVNCIITDRSGIIWMGTNSGLFKIDPRKYKFIKYSTHNLLHHLPNNYIRGICVKDNQIWLGFKQGKVQRLTIDTLTGKVLSSDEYPVDIVGVSKFTLATINTIHISKDGRVWAGGTEGLFLLDKGKDHFTLFRSAKVSPFFMEIWSLYEDDNGYLWAGTGAKGLLVINLATMEEVYYNPEPSAVRIISPGPNGSLWLGTNAGLFTISNPYDYAHIRLKPYKAPDGSGLANRHVWSIQQDGAGNWWLGTTDRGLYLLEKPLKRLVHFSKRNGLPSEVICGLLKDASGTIWASTSNGLARYNALSRNFTVFKEEDGLISNDFNFNACATGWGNQLFFGSKLGMISFNPARLMPRDTSATLAFTSFRIWGRESLYTMNHSQMQLLPGEDFFQVKFALLDYTNPVSHRFRYRLEGFDRDWIYTDGPQATYTKVPPGKYMLEVQASPDGTTWLSRTSRLSIVVKPAFWQRTWFQVSAVALLMGIAGLLGYRRVQRVIREAVEKRAIRQQIVELELKALQAQMNPHFIFNSINSIQHYIVKKDVVQANEYLTKFARLMRMFLESSKNSFTTLEEELQLLGLYLALENLRFDGQFTYSISCPPSIPRDAEMPTMLIQPFVENAINHGLIHKEGTGHLDIRVSLDNNMLHWTVDDNGIGREAAAQMRNVINHKHRSRGMELVQERLKTYGIANNLSMRVEITDKQPPEQGTRVDLYIPLNHKLQ